MPELTRASELVRVTQVPFRRATATIIRGVPVREDQTTASATYNVSIVANSECLPVDPTPGQIWRVEGHKRTYLRDQGHIKTQEHQYREPETLEFLLPDTGETFVQFIADDKAFKGIGDGKARQIWARFGEDIHRMLTAGAPEDYEALSELLSEQSMRALLTGYEKYVNLRHTVWMSKARIPHSIQRRILRHHGLGTVDAIKADPYQLLHFGLDFRKVDGILNHRFGHAWEKKRYPQERTRAAMVQALKDKMKDGSTWVKVSQLKTKASDYLLSPALCNEGIEWLKNSPDVALYHPDGRFHATATAIQELAVAKRLKHLIDARQPLTENEELLVNDVIGDLPYELTSQQALAIYTSLTEGISAITGGAGTGKTTVIAAFLKAADRLGYSINAVALPGRAAMRLHESVGYVTMTVARFLREDPVIHEKALLVIDEASMIDLPTMYRLINHINPNCKLVLTGDPSQSPPLGVGKILRDLTRSKHVPNTMLDIVKRPKVTTGIPEYSHAINLGEVPELLSTGSIHFHELSDPDIALEKAVQLYVQQPAGSGVIAPTKLLVDKINREIQDQVNGQSPLLNRNLDGKDFRPQLRLHDQVLFTQNHPSVGVQNTSFGKLTSVDQAGDVVGSVKLDTGDVVELEGALIDDLSLGYGIMLQEAQGSPFDRIIILLKDSPMLDRSWIYTAITRAVSEVHIIGDPEVLARHVNAQPKAFRRKTMLTNLIDHLVTKGESVQ
ncbi:AAA family ATPase [Marinobacter sp. BW6]|uniref:AAA family ATPase n=1 Tax=Marinobacter sp. BW6 TaxID=2592624 RepID=UPI0011DEBA51|nr:AAA family ATPase [Marinobacter sp. BW6]TYC59494.1 AAA family ATPase [Marinobacter sp. BW6]